MRGSEARWFSFHRIENAGLRRCGFRSDSRFESEWSDRRKDRLSAKSPRGICRNRTVTFPAMHAWPRCAWDAVEQLFDTLTLGTGSFSPPRYRLMRIKRQGRRGDIMAKQSGLLAGRRLCGGRNTELITRSVMATLRMAAWRGEDGPLVLPRYLFASLSSRSPARCKVSSFLAKWKRIR